MLGSIFQKVVSITVTTSWLTFSEKEKQENKIKIKKYLISSILLYIGAFLADF